MSIRNNNKGMELAINTIVIIIIGVILVAAGIVVMKKMTSGATNIVKDIDSVTQSKIDKMLADGKQLAVPSTSPSIHGGDRKVFFFGLQNRLGQETTFNIDISLTNVREVKTGKEILLPEDIQNKIKIITTNDDVKLEPNGITDDQSFMVIMPKGSPKGVYDFTIKITYKINNINKFYDASVITVNVR